MSTSTPLLYGPVAHVPLIKAPSLRVPPPVPQPNSLHPLPLNITEYFVYPFTLEDVVVQEKQRRETVQRQEVQRLAPGYEGGPALVPTQKHQATASRDPMDQLVDQLEAMDASNKSG